MRPFPPMKNLVAFEAAMRLESFAAAAEDLNVTPGAVGQQIQKLEEWLGAALFVRQVRQVKPTAEGRAYFAQIQPALAEIVHASRRLRERKRNVVTLSMPPSFAGKWFAPRMADFLTKHPGFALSLNTSPAVMDFDLDAVDLAVRHFDGDAPRLSVELLCHDEARAYCAPAYAKRIGLKRPEDLRGATLLHNALHPHWNPWLERYSALSDAQIGKIAGLEFDQSLMAIEAAVHAQGVVLTGPVLVEAEVATGMLVQPFDGALALSTGFYLVHPDTAEIHENVRILKQWFIEEMSKGARQTTSGASPETSRL